MDPIHMRVVFYPETQARKLESAYASRIDGGVSEVYLGIDFYCATVHFPNDGGFYQTTPGKYDGMFADYKYPGYRSVRRLTGESSVKVGAKRVSGEWRFCTEAEAEHILHVLLTD